MRIVRVATATLLDSWAGNYDLAALALCARANVANSPKKRDERDGRARP